VFLVLLHSLLPETKGRKEAWKGQTKGVNSRRDVRIERKGVKGENDRVVSRETTFLSMDIIYEVFVFA
jgi:hypothetical protein